MTATYRANPSATNWNDCLANLGTEFDRWGVRRWAWTCPASNLASNGRGRSHWAMLGYAVDMRAVTVSFTHPKAGERTVTVDRFSYPVDNLWAIWKGINAIRLNELRGLDDVARQVYGLLPAPARERDPWEVLGLRPDADEDAIDAVYRAKAKRLHPDAGGSAEAFGELQRAYEKVKAV